MAVAIRLQRVGKPKQPYYRVVAIDRRQAPQGKPIEILGSYNPRAGKAKEKIRVKQERVDYWIKTGARPSETVASLLKAASRPPSSEEKPAKKKPSKKSAAKAAAATKAEAAPKKKEEAPAEKKEGS